MDEKDTMFTTFVIIKGEIGVRICSMGMWGKGVPQWARAEASCPLRDQTHDGIE